MAKTEDTKKKTTAAKKPTAATAGAKRTDAAPKGGAAKKTTAAKATAPTKRVVARPITRVARRPEPARPRAKAGEEQPKREKVAAQLVGGVARRVAGGPAGKPARLLWRART